MPILVFFSLCALFHFDLYKDPFCYKEWRGEDYRSRERYSVKVVGGILSFFLGIASVFFVGASPQTVALIDKAITLASEITWDTKSKAIVTPSGSLPSGHPFAFFIPQPWNNDFYSDNYICFPVAPDLYPNGIRIKRFGGVIDTNQVVDTVQMKYWDARDDNESFAAKDVTTLIFDKKLQTTNNDIDVFVPAKTLLYLDLPSSKRIRWLSVWGYFEVCSPTIDQAQTTKDKK